MIVLELAIAPALVGAATLAARRWGDRVAGVVSALPVIVGPALLITAREHGEAFAATAAEATLLGLVSLSAFLLVYGRAAAAGRSWAVCFALAWLVAGAVALGLSGVDSRSPVGLLAAGLSLAVAYRGLSPEPGPPPRPGGWAGSVSMRMLVTAALVAAIAAAAGRLGPVAGGVLAALPVLASVLAVATHRRDGAAAAIALLRGMAAGMTGFVAFCQVVALSGGPLSFVAASVLAIAAQALVLALSARRPTTATASWGVPSVWRRWTYSSRASSRPSSSSAPK